MLQIFKKLVSCHPLFKIKRTFSFNKINGFFFAEFSRYSKFQSNEINFSVVHEILSSCSIENNFDNDDSIRIKYCPLCEKPHNEEPTNLNTLIIYKSSLVFYCFRCGNKGHFRRLFKILSKSYDLEKYKKFFNKGGYSSNGNTTENDDFFDNKNKNIYYVRKEELNNPQLVENFNVSDSNQVKNNNYINPNTNINTNQTNYKSKHTIDNSYLILDLYKRNLLMNDSNCSFIVDYLVNDRKLSLETLNHYKVGVSYEKFKSNTYDYIDLPCVTYPMFHPIDKNSIFSVDKNKIDSNLYEYYNCGKFYLARLKIRAIGKELKHFQRVEPHSAVISGLFGMDTVPDNAEEIIITEGEYDAMAAYQELKMPCVSLPNGATNLPTQVLPYFKRFKKIYLWMDSDQAGQVAVNNFSKKLGEKRTYIINTLKEDPNGPKDANDALREGKNFKHYINNAKLVSGDTIIRMGDIMSDVLKFLTHYDQFTGYKSLSFPFFNKKLKGLRVGEFTIFTGETGSGKTTFLSQLSLDFLRQNVPTLWGSFEIKNDKLASLLLMQYAKKNLRHAPIPEIQYFSENFEKLPFYMLKFHGSQNIDEIINSMEFAVYNYDIQNIVLDNLQFMIGSPSKFQNKFDYQDDIIHRLRKFCTEKNVHVTLVIHPRKDEILKISSIFGTGKASQEADNIFILQSFRGIKILDIAKNRFDGTVGKIAIGFDINTSRFFEMTLEEVNKITNLGLKTQDIADERILRYGKIEIDEDKVNQSSNQPVSEKNKIPSVNANIIDELINQKEKEVLKKKFDYDEETDNKDCIFRQLNKEMANDQQQIENKPKEGKISIKIENNLITQNNQLEIKKESLGNVKNEINKPIMDLEKVKSDKISSQVESHSSLLKIKEFQTIKPIMDLEKVKSDIISSQVESDSTLLKINEFQTIKPIMDLEKVKSDKISSQVESDSSLLKINEFQTIKPIMDLEKVKSDIISSQVESDSTLLKIKEFQTIKPIMDLEKVKSDIISSQVDSDSTLLKINEFQTIKPIMDLEKVKSDIISSQVESDSSLLKIKEFQTIKPIIDLEKVKSDVISSQVESDSTLLKIKEFQTNIFPNVKELNNFHTPETKEKTELFNSKQNRFEKIKSSNKFDSYNRQSTYKLSKESLLDDIF